MKLPDALQGIRQLAFDTAPLIYFIEHNPNYFDRMLFIMRYVNEGVIDGVGASIVLTEILVQPFKTNNQELVERYKAVLTDSNNFRLEPITSSVARSAADLRARYNLRTPDALHLAVAIDARCDAFLTNDFGFKRVTEIQVLALDDLRL